MITFELRTTARDTSGAAHWVSVARVSVSDNGEHLIEDPNGLIDLHEGHYSPRVDGPVYLTENPEEWARALTATFNAPDLVPAVIADTDPWAIPEVEDLTPRLARTALSDEQVPVQSGAPMRIGAR